MTRWLVVLFLGVYGLIPAGAQTLEQKKETVAYLQSCHQKDGGFLPAKPLSGRTSSAVSSLRATSAGLRALKYLGGTVSDKESCADFVRRCFDRPSGGFADHPGGQPEVVSTAVGLMALVELNVPLESYRAVTVQYLDDHVESFEDIRIAAAGLEAVQAKAAKTAVWLDKITKLLSAKGTFDEKNRAARTTGGAVVAMLRLGAKVDSVDKVIQVLKAGQRSDGGFGREQANSSDLETTYRVMRCFVMLKERPDVDRLRGFIARCRNTEGGYGVAPGQPSTVGATYFAATVLHWLDEKP